ncbi:MAG: hypothetical protein KU38_11960 [Sulfurovum sp. FS08-3]|nr:MAG: hypothetical protein KU38_11960 [Sulfurovum sp. FS08-3]
MRTNKILERITKALYLNVNDIAHIYELAHYPKTKDEIRALLQDERSKKFQEATYEDLGLFLDGLIIKKRGEMSNSLEEELALDNNLILKKLRVALNLKTHELVMIFALNDMTLSPSQINALFRKEGHKNYRLCSDKMLFDFLAGLEEFNYVGEE